MINGNVIRQVNDGGNTWVDCSEDAFKRAKANGTPVRKVHLNDESFRAAFDVWQDKTDWVQKDRRFDVLKPWGMHRADVLKAYIEHLETRIAELSAGKVGNALLERESHHEEVVGKLVDRISELEESNAQVIQSRDHYKCMTEEGLKQLARRVEEMEEVCAEAYQVVGVLADAAGVFETSDAVSKALDNLSEAKMVHTDVLPFSVDEPAPVVRNEREAFEAFMAKRFGDLVDQRRAKNGDHGYVVWDMAVAWIVWQARAAMLQVNSGGDDGPTDLSERNQPGMVVAVHIDAGDFVKFRGQVYEVKETFFDDHDVTLWFVCGEVLKCAAGCQIEVVSAPEEVE